MNKTISTKKVKPAYVVDITKCETVQDMILAFGMAKQKAGFPITDEELDAIVDANSYTIIVSNICCECENKPAKKGNIFKRFWKWFKHLFA